MSIMHVVSVSGGKDSLATLLLALYEHDKANVRAVFADTGNEHELTYEYIDYLEDKLQLPITRLRQDFSAQILRKRDYVLKHWAAKGVSDERIERAVKALKPTGNPYLDLCIWKGRFPSRTVQFCTEQLKTIPLTEHCMGFIERGEAQAVWSWQGVRLDESESRRTRLGCIANIPACDKSFEEVGGGLFNYRPILRWTALDCFEVSRLFGVKDNPLYRMGMGRVGCMPCINASKDEILEISKRFPGHIDRIEHWEWLVGQASRRQIASFFPDPDRDAHLNKRGIRNVVKWSTTQRGGRHVDRIRVMEEPKECSSAYNLCE